MHSYVRNKFTNAYKATIGADFSTKSVLTDDGKRLAVQAIHNLICLNLFWLTFHFIRFVLLFVCLFE